MKIARLRKEREITQSSLAQICGTSQQQIAKIEGGIVDPRLSTLRRIAEALAVEVCQLFWQRDEFLAEIETAIKANGIDLKNLKLTELNAICSRKFGLPAFHPYWEDIKIVKGKVVFEGGK